MSSVLVLVFHPDFAASRVNRAMVNGLRNIDAVSIHDVYARYPDFDVDVLTEQALCEQHDVLVFQYPIQWYSCPALMKEWIDRVLTYGWAHGPDGTKLRDKLWLTAASAGWQESDYRHEARNRATLSEFFMPMSQTAAHCGMRWLEPLILYGSRHADMAQIRAHVQTYRERLVSLRDRID